MPENPSATPLTDFLLSLANDEALASYNRRSVANADKFLEGLGLNEAQRAAVLSRDVSAIAYQLGLEGANKEFTVPGGPTMDPPVRFRTVLEGTMDPDPFPPPTMDPYATSRKPSGRARPGRKNRGGSAAKKSRAAAKSRKSAAKKTAKASKKRRKK